MGFGGHARHFSDGDTTWKTAWARRHVLRVEAGNPVIGFDTSPEAGIGIIACPAVNSRLLNFNRNDPGLSPLRWPEGVVPLIEKWIDILSAAGAATATPKSFQPLSPGEEVVVGDQFTAVMPRTGVAWARLLEESFCLRGNHEMPSPALGGFYPVCRSAWLECAAHSRMTCLNTLEWLEADPQWSGLRQYQGQIFTSAVTSKRRVEAIERARMAAVRESDARALEGPLQKLAAPLHDPGLAFLDPGVAVIDPLLGGCLQVAEAAGIPVSAAPYPQEISKQREPIKFFSQTCRIRTRQVVLKGRWWEEESVPMVGFYQQGRRPAALLKSLSAKF